MKIKIESDVFDIVDRIRDIDNGYFIVFDTVKQKFEVHNMNQICSYCFTSKFDSICKGMIDEILFTSVQNIDNIINDIDKNNKDNENNHIDKMKDKSEYMFKEIYSYFNNSSKDYDEDIAFSTVWR